MPITPDRLSRLKDVVEGSITKTQFDFRKETFSRVVEYVKSSSSEEELYAQLLNDFPAWTATLLNGDHGKPIILAPWQADYAALMDEYRYTWAMACRKVGKSTLLSAWALFRACKDRKRIICYAPTWGQDFVYKDILRFFKESPFLQEKYIIGEGALTKTYTQLANGSEIVNRTIGLQSKGELTLGEKADIITVDEIELIEKSVFVGIIRPILIDAYSEKNLALIGTPKLDANPVLDQDWDNWQKCENVRCPHLWEAGQQACPECGAARVRATLAVDYLRGIDEGCVNRELIESQMLDMTEDEIDMWFRARFPAEADRFYPRLAMWECAKDNLDFLPRAMPGRKYGLSVDWAQHVDRTEVLVAEVDDVLKTLTYVYWHRFDPKKNKASPEAQVEFVKGVFRDFKAEWINVDATNTQDQYIRMLTSGTDAIAPARFHKDEKDRMGYIASGERNYDMHLNHKRQILRGAIRVPKQRPFIDSWVNQHVQLKATSVASGRYIKLDEPKNGFRDLAVTSAMLSLYLLNPATPAFMGLSTW